MNARLRPLAEYANIFLGYFSHHSSLRVTRSVQFQALGPRVLRQGYLALAAAIGIATVLRACARLRSAGHHRRHYVHGLPPVPDSYYNPVPDRIIRKIPGNGQDVLIDLQCNGDTVDGIVGSAPVPIYYATGVTAGLEVHYWIWPAPHVVRSSFRAFFALLWTFLFFVLLKKRGHMIIILNGCWTTMPCGSSSPRWTDDGLWASMDILSENGSIYTFTIPASLKPGVR